MKKGKEGRERGLLNNAKAASYVACLEGEVL